MLELNAELSYSRVIVFAEGNVHGAIVGSRPAQQKTTAGRIRDHAALQRPRRLGSFRLFGFRTGLEAIGNDRRESHTNHVLGCGINYKHVLKPRSWDKRSIHGTIKGGEKRGLFLFATARISAPFQWRGARVCTFPVSACKSRGNPFPVTPCSAWRLRLAPILQKAPVFEP